jgi:hypothetical protein
MQKYMRPYKTVHSKASTCNILMCMIPSGSYFGISEEVATIRFAEARILAIVVLAGCTCAAGVAGDSCNTYHPYAVVHDLDQMAAL